MLSNIRISSQLCLLGLTALLQTPLMAQESEEKTSVTIIQPQKKLSPVDVAAIDSESYELGFYLGSLSVEDFGTNQLTGISFAYHINPSFVAQLSLATSDIAKATFEDVVSQDFLADKDRDFEYTQLSVGYQVFHGRSFFGAKNKFNSHLYLVAGLENVSFAGEKQMGYVVGTNYKVVTTDWLTLNFNLQDHIYEREFLAEKKVTNNIEFSVGLNLLF